MKEKQKQAASRDKVLARYLDKCAGKARKSAMRRSQEGEGAEATNIEGLAAIAGSARPTQMEMTSRSSGSSKSGSASGSRSSRSHSSKARSGDGSYYDEDEESESSSDSSMLW